MPLIILFGPTGAGKTYVGQLIQKHFGYYFYDGDADLTPEMKQALNLMRPITDPMRDRFIGRLLDSITKLLKIHPNLVVAQTFIKERYRHRLLKRWPKARFILLKTKTNLRYQRRRERADYPWDETYVKRMDAIFETPKIPHQIITNDKTGPDNLLKRLRSLLSG